MSDAMSDAIREVRAVRPVLDVHELPSHTFGSRGEMWWGTLGFMVIEGVTLALAAVSYFYLRKNFHEWPPAGTPPPRLLAPTLNVIVMLISMWPAYRAKHAAEHYDKAGARHWLLVCSGFALLIAVLRAFEFGALETRWDSNAYGSAAWVILGFHTTLLLIDVADTVGLAAIMSRERVERKHFSGTADNSNYWYFLVWSWVVLYAIVFWGPRLF